VDIGVVKDKVVLFPIDQVPAPHVKDALHVIFLDLIMFYIGSYSVNLIRLNLILYI
jgi:hypothetical protein